jgi:hypothetical protein
MAVGIKLTKKKKPRATSLKIRKNLLQDPNWDGADGWSGKEFHQKRQAATDYYYQNYKVSDLHDFAFTWMLANEYTKQDIKCVKAAKSQSISAVTGYYCRMLTMGCPDEHLAWNAYWEGLAGTSGTPKPISDFIKKRIANAIDEGTSFVKEAEEKAILDARLELNTRKPTIQELLHRAAIDMTGEVEDFLDVWLNSGYDTSLAKDFEPTAMLKKAGVKTAHARIIRKYYADAVAEFAELNAKVSKDDKDDNRLQLEEGYSHMSTAQQKAALAIYRKIEGACDICEAEGKLNRKVRKVRTKSPEDLVKKLKFKQSDPDYGLASILPADIVYARMLVVFNTRNRKLGIYYASNVDPMGLQREGSGLSVKGTTIIGYDENKSIQRTIRKPAEVLPQMKKSTRSKLEKLVDSLKTTETKLNGRINGETILIATFNK